MVVDRRHSKHALPRKLERHHLHDDGYRLEYEQTADHRQHDLVLGGHRNCANHSAKSERAGIAHEYRGRRRVEPKEAQSRPYHRPAQHREFASPGDIVDVEVIGEERVAGKIRDEAEAERDDDDGNDSQSVEAIGQIHRVAGAHDDERTEHNKEPAEWKHELLEEWESERRREGLASDGSDDIAGRGGNQRLEDKAQLPGKAGVSLLRHLEIVVVEANRAEGKGDAEHDPHVAVGGLAHSTVETTAPNR